MSQTLGKRRLVALMFTDIVGYSTLSGKDEKLALQLLEEHRVIFRRIFPVHGGRENKTIGDAFFLEFGSAVDAFECAVELQTAFFERNASVPEDHQVQVRIGLHLGDVIEHDGDTYGDGVNIAARTEALAIPGGVCMTRQVADQVAGKVQVPFKRVGSVELKNIAKPTDVYQVIFPWHNHGTGAGARIIKFLRELIRPQVQQSALSTLERLRGVLLGSQTAAIWSVLLLLAFFAYGGADPRPFDVLSRSPAAASAPRVPVKQSLESGWRFLVDPAARTPEDAVAAPAEAWHEFDIKAPWKTSDILQGNYWLRKDFTLEADQRFQFPSIVLGSVYDSHRVFLNGRFIGGSNHFPDVEAYNFDRELLRYGFANVLLLRVHSNPGVSPGLTYYPSVGTYLSEFDVTYKTKLDDRQSFHQVRTVYFSLVLLAALGCNVFYLANRQQRKYLYFGLYLVLGSVLLTYGNILVMTNVDYRFLRFSRTLSLILSGFVLFSAYLALKRNRPLELVNNAAAVVFVLVTGWLALPRTQPPSSYLGHYNSVLTAAAIYNVAWVAFVALRFFWKSAHELLDPKKRMSARVISRVNDLMFLFFGTLSGMMLTISIKNQSVISLLDPVVRHSIDGFASRLPFLFAIYVLVAGLVDYIGKTWQVDYKKDRDNLLLELVKTAEEARGEEELLSRLQGMLAEFIGAERSTLYVLEKGKNNENWLKASFMHGTSAIRSLVKPSVLPQEGVIGYACASRAPLLIKDIRSDLRFGHLRKAGAERKSYKSGSCMVFPLLIGGELYGVLTLADKAGARHFTQDDFALIRVVSKNLALILSNSRLRERVARQEKAA